MPIREFNSSDSLADEEYPYTVVCSAPDESPDEEIDVAATPDVSPKNILAFVQGVLDEDYVPGMKAVRVEPYHGGTFFKF